MINKSSLSDSLIELYKNTYEKQPELFSCKTKDLLVTDSGLYYEVPGVVKHKNTHKITSEIDKNKKDKDIEIER